MRHLDLFSGIGGFALAAQWVWGSEHEIVSFCEIDPFCRKVLKKHWPDVPVCKNIKELNGDNYGTIDILTGGFPCQPYSVAGNQLGNADDRALWPEMSRVIRQARPRWVVAENVPGIVAMELDGVLSDLEDQGYTCRPFVIPACAVDAPHRRDRVWIVADADNAGCKKQRLDQPAGAKYPAPECGCRWTPEPELGRVAYGIPDRVDRLKALGNAIVPQVAVEIFKGIKQIDET